MDKTEKYFKATVSDDTEFREDEPVTEVNSTTKSIGTDGNQATIAGE